MNLILNSLIWYFVYLLNYAWPHQHLPRFGKWLGRRLWRLGCPDCMKWAEPGTAHGPGPQPSAEDGHQRFYHQQPSGTSLWEINEHLWTDWLDKVLYGNYFRNKNKNYNIGDRLNPSDLIFLERSCKNGQRHFAIKSNFVSFFIYYWKSQSK